MIKRLLMSAVVTYSLLGCGIEMQSVAPSAPPSELIMSIEPEYRTYNLSMVQPYDTVTLKIRGVSSTGTTLDLPISFSYDTNYVDISSNGILRAKSAVASTRVIVSMSSHGATRFDTLLVSVIAASPRHLTRVAIEPSPGDSAKFTFIGMGGRETKSLQLIRADSSGSPVTAVLVSIRSTGKGTATQSGNNVVVRPTAPGRGMIYVSTYAYGVGFRDSLAFTIGWPLLVWSPITEQYVTGSRVPVLSLPGSKVIIGVGGCVIWQQNSVELETDIVFDDPSVALPADSAPEVNRSFCLNTGGWGASVESGTRSGNISSFRTELSSEGWPDVLTGMRVRTFKKPGVYTYRSSTYNFVGTIIVCDEQDDPSCAVENYPWGSLQQ